MRGVKPEQRGFTLLEMMIALVVFAMLSLAGYQMLAGLSRTGEVSQSHSEELAALQRTFSLMAADFRQATMSPLRGMKLQGVAGEQGWLGSDQGGVSLIRTGWKNIQATEARGGVLRVGYRVDGGELIRQFYRYLNPLGQKPPQQQVLLKGVEELRFRFYEKGGGWQTRWHRNDQMPQAVEVTFKLAGWGGLRRVFLLPPEYQPVETTIQAQEDEAATD